MTVERRGTGIGSAGDELLLPASDSRQYQPMTRTENVQLQEGKALQFAKV